MNKKQLSAFELIGFFFICGGLVMLGLLNLTLSVAMVFIIIGYSMYYNDFKGN